MATAGSMVRHKTLENVNWFWADKDLPKKLSMKQT